MPKKKISERILIWKEFKSWKEFVEGIIPLEVQDDLKRDLRKKENSFEYEDDYSALREIYDQHADYDEFISRFTKEFRSYFPFVKMFHGGRPTDPGSYRENGIQILDVDSHRKKFRSLFFGNPKFPRITEELLLHCEENDQRDVREGRVYLCMDDRFLVKNCYHYLLCGSEYLQGFATRIGEKTGYNLMRELSQVGTPTVVEVKAPSDFIPDNEIETLGPDAIQNWALMVQNKRKVYEIDFGIELNQTIPGNLILGQYIPENVEDRWGAFI